jgi:HEAT repeats
MPLKLPHRPDLAHLRTMSKELLVAARKGETRPLQRLATVFPGVTQQTARLSQAQTVLARDYGFANWPTMAAEVERRAAIRKAKAERTVLRTQDAEQLVELWFSIAESGDLERLWPSMIVSATRMDQARIVVGEHKDRRDQLVLTLMRGLQHPKGRVRFEYAHLLDTFGDARCVEPLMALMDDPVPRVRWMAMHALTCHGCNPETCSEDPELIARIASAARQDENLRVRFHATIALGSSKSPLARPLLEDLLATAPNAKLKRAAEYGLRAL